MQNLKENQIYKWQQKFAEFSLEKFQMKHYTDIKLKENNDGQFQQISFSQDSIYLILDNKTIATIFYGQEQVHKQVLDNYLQQDEFIVGIKKSNQDKFSILSLITSSNRLLFFQGLKQNQEEMHLDFFYEYKVEESAKIDRFYWKKNKVYFSIENKKIYEIDFLSLKQSQEQDNEKSLIEEIPTVKVVVELQQQMLFWECSYVTNLFYILQEDKMQVINGANDILYELRKDEINFDISYLKAYRQTLQVKPLTEENFLNYNYSLKDLIIILNNESKIQVLDVGRMKNKDLNEIRLCEFDIHKKLNLPDFAKYENLQISKDNKYLTMINKEFSHFVIFKINEAFAKAQNHDKNFKNVFPFFEQIACITFPKDTVHIGFQIEQGDKIIGQLAQQKKDIKDVLIVIYQTSQDMKFSVVPLDIVFQLQEEYEENNVSKIEMDELSIIENDTDKHHQKKQKILKELSNEKQQNKYVIKQGQVQEVESLQYQKKNSDKKNKKQEKKLVISNPIDYLENTNKKKAKIERKLQQHKSNSIKMQEMKDGTSKVSNTQKKEDLDDLFDNLQLQKKQDNNLQFDENIEKQIKDTVKNFEQNLRTQLEQQMKQHKLQFNKEFGQTYHQFLDQFKSQYQKEFQENNEKILYPLIEQSFKTTFEKYTLKLNETYMDYQTKIETTIQMQNNLKYNLENVFSKRDKNNKKLQKALDNNFKALEQLQVKKTSEEFIMQNMKKNIEELQENQAAFLEQIEEISKYVHELENKLAQKENKINNNREQQQESTNI